MNSTYPSFEDLKMAGEALAMAKKKEKETA